MIVQTPANDGLFVYVDARSLSLTSKLLELRFEHNERGEYYCDMFGNYIPCVRYNPDGLCDRVFIKIPPVEDVMVFPLYFTRVTTSHIYFEEEFFLFTDYWRSPQHLLARPGSDFAIVQDSFELREGKVAVDLTGDFPIKIKIEYLEEGFHSTYHLYDPNNSLKKWEIEIDDLDVWINGVQANTDILDTYTGMLEVDFGWTETTLHLNFYEKENLLLTLQDASPIDEATDIVDTFMEIEQTTDNYTNMLWWMAAHVGSEPTSVVGTQENTDYFELITTGLPRLTNRSRWGTKFMPHHTIEDSTSIQRTVTYSEKELFGIVKRIAEPACLQSFAELYMAQPDSTEAIGQLILQGEATDSFVSELATCMIEYDLGLWGTKLAAPEVECVDAYPLMLAVQREANRYASIQRKVMEMEEKWYALKATYADNETELVAKLVPALTVDQEFSPLLTLIMMAFAKTVRNLYIKTEAYTPILIKVEEYGLEVESYD